MQTRLVNRGQSFFHVARTKVVVRWRGEEQKLTRSVEPIGSRGTEICPNLTFSAVIAETRRLMFLQIGLFKTRRFLQCKMIQHKRSTQ